MIPLSKPPKKIEKLSSDERKSINQSIIDGSDIGILWLEKIRKFISYHNRNLRKVSKKRFDNDCNDYLLWFRDIIMKQINLKGDFRIDSGLINAALIVNDACLEKDKHSHSLRIILKKLESQLVESSPVDDKDIKISNRFNLSFENWKTKSIQLSPVTIFCPSSYSLFSISVLNICLKLNIPVKAVVIRNFSTARIKSELYRDGTKLFIKRVWRKLVLRSDENSDKAKISLKFLKDQLSPKYGDIRDIAKLHKINFHLVESFESSLSLEKNTNGDVCLFTGGGLINQKILDYFDLGIINVHMGLLPQYKGMDVVEAPILDGCFNNVALTSHIMEKDLDSGPIIDVLYFSSDEYQTLGELRNEMGALMPVLSINALIKLFSNSFKPIPQISSGQQYYFIHSDLREILNRIIPIRFNRLGSENKKIRSKNLELFSSVLEEFNLK